MNRKSDQRKPYPLILLLFFLFITLGSRGQKADSLLIKYSNWNIEPSHVSTCSNFEVIPLILKTKYERSMGLIQE